MAVQIDDSYGMLIDLSKGGMRIIPDVLPNRFEGIRISFITESGEPIELLGNIARIVDKKEKNDNYELALSIPNIPENYSNYIEALEKDQHPSGIFQEAVREDLVKAVLSGKEEDLIPKTDAKETHHPTPHEDLAGEIENIPLEEIFEEDNQLSLTETKPHGEQEPASDKTVAMPLDQVALEPQQPVPAENLPPAVQEAPPPNITNIPLDEEFQEEQQKEAPEVLQPPVQEPTGDQTIVMPANRLPYQPSETEKEKNDKPAPKRVEVSFEEFLQKNPQIIQPVTPPPMPKKPPPKDEASLNEAFSEEPQTNAPGQSPGTPEAPPTEDEQSLDKALQVDQQADMPTMPPPEDDPLDKIFSEQEQS